MNKQVEQIRAEVERLYDGKAPAHDQQCDFDDGYFTGIDAISKFLDSLPEEKPSKDLDEAAMAQANPVFFGGKIVDYLESKYESFIAGAEWQKEQFEKNRLSNCDTLTKEEYDRETTFAMEIIEKEHRQPTFTDAINYGMRLQKERMMEDAIGGEIVHDIYSRELRCKTIDLRKKKCYFGEKVKIIIVKEEKQK